jgi:hypothetical protein
MMLNRFKDRTVCQVCLGAIGAHVKTCPTCDLAAHVGCSTESLLAGDRDRLMLPRGTRRPFYNNGDQLYLPVCLHCTEDET